MNGAGSATANSSRATSRSRNGAARICGGRTILLHAEQGFGDIIQFIRYLPMVVAKGGKVVLEIPDDLKPLIGRIDGVAAIVRRGDALPPFDVHCPLMSLPLAFGTTLDTIPAPVPYLHPPAERVSAWRIRLAGTKAPRVGLVWSGKPTHKNDHNRSIPLTLLAPLLRTPGVTFVSLQKEYRDADRAALAAVAAAPPRRNRLPTLPTPRQ